ncbi:MAG: hypothetical protein BAJALOKI1v1_30002 [Promethearchaeota archaeon]|nr:MAG: hypothetical protein BAJALOKI1v1_30002 [Candidatus Lokiarchaeota archaeon]
MWFMSKKYENDFFKSKERIPLKSLILYLYIISVRLKEYSMDLTLVMR